MNDPRYPIGAFEAPAAIDAALREELIRQIEETPARLREAVRGLSGEQLDEPYREGGWTARQVVHHLPESHMNAYIRFKLAMTEQEPTIRPYDEVAWAKLPDAARGDVEPSLALLEALHRRWVIFLRDVDGAALDRTFRHPEIGTVTLGWALAQYAWHGRHHTAHVTSLRERMGW